MGESRTWRPAGNCWIPPDAKASASSASLPCSWPVSRWSPGPEPHPRAVWAVRHESGAVSECDTEEQARFLVFDPSWRAMELLCRNEQGGGWTMLVDARGLEQRSDFRWVRIGDQVFWDGQWREVISRYCASWTTGPAPAGMAVFRLTGPAQVVIGPTGQSPQESDQWPVRVRRRRAIRGEEPW